jgi:hypothetical protein
MLMFDRREEFEQRSKNAPKGREGVKVNHKFTLDPHLTKYTIIGRPFLDGRKLASSRFILGGADPLSPQHYRGVLRS